jgi:hypothetical protein
MLQKLLLLSDLHVVLPQCQLFSYWWIITAQIFVNGMGFFKHTVVIIIIFTGCAAQRAMAMDSSYHEVS